MGAFSNDVELFTKCVSAQNCQKNLGKEHGSLPIHHSLSICSPIPKLSIHHCPHWGHLPKIWPVLATKRLQAIGPMF